MKILLKSEDDLLEYKSSCADKNEIYNSPEEYPCLIVSDYYKRRHETNEYGRFLEFLYRKDVLELMMPAQREIANNKSMDINPFYEDYGV